MGKKGIVKPAQLEPGPGAQLAAELEDGVGARQVGQCRPGEQAVLDRLGSRRRRSEAHVVAIEGRRLVQNPAPLVEAHVDHSPGGHAETAVSHS